MDEIFETLIVNALKKGATDIHIKNSDHLEISMRILGHLDPYKPKTEIHGERLINYLKYKALINVNFKLVPQTGSFHYEINNHTYFLRVSYLPGLDFESIVIRILNNHNHLTIHDLSKIEVFTKFLEDITKRQSGLFLVSGATGSGKSTTLYAILDEIIEKGGRNIVTLEDPIEMVKEHCLQIEMNDTLGIDYASTLKQILRHDPDVIMIGEIRDEETAGLAVTCALTGHLVLSTIHASSAPLVIKRLLNLNISKTDIEDVLIGIVTQRMKYDLKTKDIIVLPEVLTRKQIKAYINDEYVKYQTFKESALTLISENHYDDYLFEEELNE